MCKTFMQKLGKDPGVERPKDFIELFFFFLSNCSSSPARATLDPKLVRRYPPPDPRLIRLI